VIAHVVLFRPHRGLPQESRRALAEAFLEAVRAIPTVRHARAGRRVTHGRPYEGLMVVDYEFVVVLEFDDMAGLHGYLEHPAHETLAARFFASFDAALMYDYDLRDVEEGLETLISS
jgi:hypothetical protein